MQDINKQLRIAYYNLLAGNVIINNAVVPVRYPMLAKGESGDNYILISGINSTNFNTDTTAFTDTFITLTIVTRGLTNNSGDNADDIAAQIYGLIDPTPAPPQEVLLMANGQVITTDVRTDTILPYLSDGLRVILNRVITFHHKIAHKKSAAVTGTIYYGVQDTGDDPTDFSNILNSNPANAFTINYGAQPLPKFYWCAYTDLDAIKQHWADINNPLNKGNIGGDTDLFIYRAMVIDTVTCWLIITQYLTGFDGDNAEVKFY